MPFNLMAHRSRVSGIAAWHRRHPDLLAAEELDAGYRLVVSA